MKTVTMYEAEDGKQFRDEAQCLEYEQQCDDLAASVDARIEKALADSPALQAKDDESIERKMIDRIELGQFVVCAGHLCEYTDRWDFWWGFLRVIKPLKETK